MVAELCSSRIEWCGLDAYVALLDIITLNPYKSPAHVPRFSLGLSCAYVLVATIVPTSHGAVNGAHMSLRPIVAASIALRMYRIMVTNDAVMPRYFSVKTYSSGWVEEYKMPWDVTTASQSHEPKSTAR